jgi:hypothetical protein
LPNEPLIIMGACYRTMTYTKFNNSSRFDMNPQVNHPQLLVAWQ